MILTNFKPTNPLFSSFKKISFRLLISIGNFSRIPSIRYNIQFTEFKTNKPIIIYLSLNYFI